MERSKIVQLIEDEVKGTEIFIVEVKISAGKIVVLIDKPHGITINECISLNRFLTAQLEPTGLLETHELEVSSPGMDQPLKVLQQYHRRIGKDVRITTIDGETHEGRLAAANENEIEIIKSTKAKIKNKKTVTEHTVRVPFATIKETKLIFTF